MKKITLTLLTILFIALTFQIGVAQDKNVHQKDLLIKVTKLLEREPFHKKAKDSREWGFLYLVETKDVSVVLCGHTMKLNPEKKNKYNKELTMQLMFGMAAFKIENPNQKNDENAAQVAGVKSMLKSYEAMKAKKKKAKNKELDALLIKRDNNELKALVEKGDCSSQKEDSK